VWVRVCVGGGRGREGVNSYLHPRATVFEPVYAWTGDELEEDVGAAVFVLCVCRLDAELV
jgi:hypothetical protein